MVFPSIDEFDLIVIVLAEINIDLHYILEVLRDHRDADILLIIYDDI